MKRAALLCVTLLLLFGMTACASGPAESGSAGGEESSAAEPGPAREETVEESPGEAPEEGDSPVQSEPGEPAPEAAEPDSASPSEQELTLSVDGTTLEVSWEDNETVRELMACAAEESITVNTSLYGGFEQVGSLPRQFESERCADDHRTRGHCPVLGGSAGAVLRLQFVELYQTRAYRQPDHRGADRAAGRQFRRGGDQPELRAS